MRRFAAKFTLQCHFSSCFSFYLGLDFLLEMSPNQAPYSSKPSSFGKVRLLTPDCFPGRVIASAPFPWAKSIILPPDLIPVPCSQVRDWQARRVPVTPPIVLK
jgi:hypothetical protein